MIRKLPHALTAGDDLNKEPDNLGMRILLGVLDSTPSIGIAKICVRSRPDQRPRTVKVTIASGKVKGSSHTIHSQVRIGAFA
jgi:deoxyinosine 3'endonuclease (endonuclease V)